MKNHVVLDDHGTDREDEITKGNIPELGLSYVLLMGACAVKLTRADKGH